jgi:hypothetical protein
MYVLKLYIINIYLGYVYFDVKYFMYLLFLFFFYVFCAIKNIFGLTGKASLIFEKLFLFYNIVNYFLSLAFSSHTFPLIDYHLSAANEVRQSFFTVTYHCPRHYFLYEPNAEYIFQRKTFYVETNKALIAFYYLKFWEMFYITRLFA